MNIALWRFSLIVDFRLEGEISSDNKEQSPVTSGKDPHESVARVNFNDKLTFDVSYSHKVPQKVKNFHLEGISMRIVPSWFTHFKVSLQPPIPSLVSCPVLATRH